MKKLLLLSFMFYISSFCFNSFSHAQKTNPKGAALKELLGIKKPTALEEEMEQLTSTITKPGTRLIVKDGEKLIQAVFVKDQKIISFSRDKNGVLMRHEVLVPSSSQNKPTITLFETSSSDSKAGFRVKKTYPPHQNVKTYTEEEVFVLEYLDDGTTLKRTLQSTTKVIGPNNKEQKFFTMLPEGHENRTVKLTIGDNILYSDYLKHTGPGDIIHHSTRVENGEIFVSIFVRHNGSVKEHIYKREKPNSYKEIGSEQLGHASNMFFPKTIKSKPRTEIIPGGGTKGLTIEHPPATTK